MKEMNRLLDANINRVSEGIRVVEDVARFVYNQKEFSKELREKRHYLRKLFIQKDNGFNGTQIFYAANVQGKNYRCGMLSSFAGASLPKCVKPGEPLSLQ